MVNQSQRLDVKLGQSLTMTPQMQQSLKILQMSAAELSVLVEEELEKNPLLEIESEKENRDDNEEISKTSASDDVDEGGAESEREIEVGDIQKDTMEMVEREDIGDNNFSDSSDDYYESGEDFRDSKSNSYEMGDDAGSIIEKTVSEEKTLNDHLIEQIIFDFEESSERAIAISLVDYLDVSGFLPTEKLGEEINEISKNLGCSRKEIDKVIEKLKMLDPAGVFAENFRECLKIQLKDFNRLDPAIEKLIDNLELLAKGEIAKLKKLCGVEDEDLADMIKEIRGLNPRPASEFAEKNMTVKIPDLILTKKNDGKQNEDWEIELNQEVMPKVLLRKNYYNAIKNSGLKDSEKNYLSASFADANFLVRALAQRAETMIRVGTEIANVQKGFFENGISHLRPLTMKDVATKLELHESTIGRVVSNKYIACPRGVFELRFFFTNALSSNVSANIEFSTETVKHRIKELIEAEVEVLSDQEIAEILKEDGINIARRTVAKYREGLNFRTSAERKRLRKMNF